MYLNLNLNDVLCQNVKMADVEDQAAKLSVEEQMQLTIIQTLENDLISGPPFFFFFFLTSFSQFISWILFF